MVICYKMLISGVATTIFQYDSDSWSRRHSYCRPGDSDVKREQNVSKFVILLFLKCV